jgi:hypothetical protein
MTDASASVNENPGAVAKWPPPTASASWCRRSRCMRG